MRGNFILIFSFIFCADKFSAAQNCSQPPPNYNASEVRKCCKIPPIESVMYKFAGEHCKDFVKTLEIAIHSKPAGNLTTSTGQGSQNIQQVQQSTQSVLQKPQSSQSTSPTTLLSNPITTTIAAITIILPITTIQSQQQATSQGPQSQQSSNQGQQQGVTQQQALGQGNIQNGENHVPHKNPPPPKMPARYTIPFMCAMECTMNQLQIVTNGKYNKENADNFLQNVLKSIDFTPVLQNAMSDCVEIASEKANKFVTTYNYTGCNTFGGHYLRCINQETANYCPNSKLSQTPNCTNLQNYIKTCGPLKN